MKHVYVDDETFARLFKCQSMLRLATNKRVRLVETVRFLILFTLTEDTR